MPVRSSSSSVHTWPDAREVDRAARRWAREVAARHPDVLAIGYQGSYARGDWGVGSDLDLLVIVEGPTRAAEAEPAPASSPPEVGEEEEHTSVSRLRGSLDVTRLPVPADVIVLDRAAWIGGLEDGRRFYRTAAKESVWLVGASRVPGVPNREDD